MTDLPRFSRELSLETATEIVEEDDGGRRIWPMRRPENDGRDHPNGVYQTIHTADGRSFRILLSMEREGD